MVASMRDRLAASHAKAQKLLRSPNYGQVQKASSGTRRFSSFAVGPTPGKPAPAGWIVDRTEYVRHNKNSVHIAAGAIARKMAQQSAKISRRIEKKSGVTLEPVKFSHPMAELFREVNEQMDEYELWYYTEGWKLLVGDAYWWKARNMFRTPKELHPLPPQWVWALPSDTKYIGGYRVKGVFSAAKEVDLPARDVVHIREPNLDWTGNGRFYGSPPLKAAAHTVDIEQAMYERVHARFRNYADPAQIFTTDQKLTDTQLRQVYNQIINQHSITDHTGRPMITHSGLKPVVQGGGGAGVKEMDYVRSLDATLTLTLAVFGVPKAIVGITDNVNKASMGGAMISFCENTVNPRLIQNGQALTYSVARDFEPDGSLVVHFDMCSAHDAEDIRKAVETASKSISLDPNEVREILFGKKPYLTGGSRPLANAGMTQQPFGNLTEEELKAELEREAEQKKQPPQLQQTDNVESDMAVLGEAVEKYLSKQHEEVVNRVASMNGNGRVAV